MSKALRDSEVTGDFVPLSERMAMLRWFRVLAGAAVLAAWAALPQTRGASEPLVFGVTGAYIVAMLAIEMLWQASRRRASWIFGVVVMCDAVYLAWASYGTAGLSSPLQALLLLQLVTVSLLASFRTGLKLAMFSSLLLVCALYAQEAGVLHVLGGRPLAFGGTDYRLVCAQIAMYWLAALVTATFAAVNERELRRRRYDLGALAQLARHLEALHEPAEIAERVLADVQDTFGCERSMLIELSSGGGGACLAVRALDAAAEIPWPIAQAELAGRAPRLSRALAGTRTALIRTTEHDADVVLAAFGPGCRLIAIPLSADGHTVGVLIAEHALRRESRVERRVVSMLESFAAHTALALAKAHLMEEVAALATIDSLTGLPNRRLLDDALARACAEALRTDAPLSVLMIDIDHFKAHNDRFGHQSGDALLRLVGASLRDTSRAMDVAARFGGEEFCVVMPGADLATAAAAGERVRAAISHIAAEQPVTASVGVACAPEHGRTPTDLTRAADEALYAAKHGGRNRVELAGTPVAVPPAAGAELERPDAA